MGMSWDPDFAALERHREDVHADDYGQTYLASEPADVDEPTLPGLEAAPKPADRFRDHYPGGVQETDD